MYRVILSPMYVIIQDIILIVVYIEYCEKSYEENLSFYLHRYLLGKYTASEARKIDYDEIEKNNGDDELYHFRK